MLAMEAQRAMQVVQSTVAESVKTVMPSVTREIVQLVNQWIAARAATSGPSTAIGVLGVSSNQGSS